MNNAAYDISHLLELEATTSAMPEFSFATPASIKPEISAVSSAQDTLARELLQMAGQHEEMIRQYLSLRADGELAADW